MASVFTMIMQGDLPGHYVWQDDQCIAIMTIQPINAGHLLVIPREEVNHWDDVDADVAAHMMKVSQKLAKALKSEFPCKRVGVIIAGLEVPHTHIHLIPVNELTDFNFALAAEADADLLASQAKQLIATLEAQGDQPGC